MSKDETTKTENCTDTKWGKKKETWHSFIYHIFYPLDIITVALLRTSLSLLSFLVFFSVLSLPSLFAPFIKPPAFGFYVFFFFFFFGSLLKGRQGVVLQSSVCSLTSNAHCLSCRAPFDVSRRCRGRRCWQQQPPVRSWREQHGQQTGSQRRIQRTVWRCSHQRRKIGPQGQVGSASQIDKTGHSDRIRR